MTTQIPAVSSSGFQMENAHITFHLSWFSRERIVGMDPGPACQMLESTGRHLSFSAPCSYSYLDTEPSFLPLRYGVYTSPSLPPKKAEKEPTAQFGKWWILMSQRELQGQDLAKGEDNSTWHVPFPLAAGEVGEEFVKGSPLSIIAWTGIIRQGVEWAAFLIETWSGQPCNLAVPLGAICFKYVVKLESR